MIQVKMLTSRYGPRYGVQNVGDIVTVSENDAAELVRIGHAEIIETAAMQPQTETRQQKRRRAR